MEVLDVTRLQKMNQLASTLTRHRLVSNRMEAAELASDIAGRSSEQSLGRLDIDDHQRFVVINDAESESKPSRSESKSYTLAQESPEFRFDERKWMTKEQAESLLQKFADAFCSEINSLNKKLDNFASKVQEFEQQKREQDNVKLQVSQASQSSAEFKKEQAQQQLVNEERKEEKRALHPTNSGISPSDVSIEKFFYYGAK